MVVYPITRQRGLGADFPLKPSSAHTIASSLASLSILYNVRSIVDSTYQCNMSHSNWTSQPAYSLKSLEGYIAFIATATKVS